MKRHKWFACGEEIFFLMYVQCRTITLTSYFPCFNLNVHMSTSQIFLISFTMEIYFSTYQLSGILEWWTTSDFQRWPADAWCASWWFLVLSFQGCTNTYPGSCAWICRIWLHHPVWVEKIFLCHDGAFDTQEKGDLQLCCRYTRVGIQTFPHTKQIEQGYNDCIMAWPQNVMGVEYSLEYSRQLISSKSSFHSCFTSPPCHSTTPSV